MAFSKIPAAILLPVMAIAGRAESLIEYFRQLVLSIDARDREISAWINSWDSKAPNDSAKFLDGTGAWSYIKTLSYTEVSSFVNSWTNLGGGWQNAAYAKTIDGWVSVIGVIKAGTMGVTAFTLPEGYRPATQRIFSVVSWDHEGRVDVDTSGNVIPKVPSENGWLTLDDIWFYAG